MRLVDFLKLLLEAHAETLKRLAAMVGEDNLLALLEQAGEREQPIELSKTRPLWIEKSHPTGVSAAYAELANSVHDFKLPSQLEFHLWAYPHYRAFIESSIDLDAVVTAQGEAGVALVDEAWEQARDWVRGLSLPAELGKRADKVAEVPWLRFRTHVLEKIGKRRLGPVY